MNEQRIEKSLRIRFMGAIGTVTGSCTLLEFSAPGYTNRYLVDAGDYQGERGDTSGKDWIRKHAADIQGLFLTHAHIDHIGFVPELVRAGFCGRIYCTEATAELTRLMLLDALGIKEPQADRSKHVELVQGLRFFILEDNAKFEFGKTHFPLCQDLQFIAFRSSHILGSCSWAFRWSREATEESRTNDKKAWTWIHFSGDIGPVYREDCPGIMFKEFQSPYYGVQNKYLVVESTYGDRIRDIKGHSFSERIERLSEVIRETILKGGNVLIPAFAMNRAQEVLIDLAYIADNRLASVAPFDRRWRVDNAKTLELSLSNDSLDHSVAVLETWKRFMGDKPMDKDCFYGDMPIAMQEELLRLDNTYALARDKGKTFTTHYYSSLLGKVNPVYAANLSDNYMTDKGDIKYKYLAPGFAEAFDLESPTEANIQGILAMALSTKLGLKKADLEKQLTKRGNVIVSSSGMCDEGAILELLEPILTNPNSAIIITGYQAVNTNGYILSRLTDLTEQERYNTTLSGTDIRLSDIRCSIVNLAPYYSGHADQEQLVEYVTGSRNERMKNTYPTTVFLNHGVDSARQALKEAILAKSPDGTITVKLPTTDCWYNLNTGLTEAIEPDPAEPAPIATGQRQEDLCASPATATKSVSVNGVTVVVPADYANDRLLRIMEFLQAMS